MSAGGFLVDLPPTWRWVRCQDVIDVRDGTHDTPKYVPTGYPLVTSKHLLPDGIDFSSARHISADDHREIQKRSHVDRGDILFAMIGTIGNPVIVDVDEEFSIKNVALFKFNNSPVHAPYFRHLLDSPIIQRQLSSGARGGNQKFVALNVLRNMNLPLPPLPEQRRIAAILDKANAIRRKRQETIRLTEELLRSAFLDMFGDPVTNPKGWPTVALGKLIVDGPNNGLYRPASDYGSGTPIIRIDSFYEGEITATELKRVRIGEAVIKKFSCKAGDVLINRVNSRKYLGKSAIVPTLSEPTVYESNMMRFSLDERRIDPWFLVFLLGHPYGRRQILNRARDAVNQSSINQQDVKSIEVLLPPRERQERFVTIADHKNGFRGRQRAEMETFDELFNSLVYRAFQGEVWNGGGLATPELTPRIGRNCPKKG